MPALGVIGGKGLSYSLCDRFNLIIEAINLCVLCVFVVRSTPHTPPTNFFSKP
ncbi:hypothetical protein MYAER_3885 [Microcystis aeruginosa NIES-2549]|uniref:Uncharacterized protein n=1 Tax=Microcystis aeruginosa NIES-2549 TaxID=1641812 RepID=A0A0F6RN93_MICAE|nr:hypothetical protein MYAER_3885 [Microcystis aeruginosa NIES-2549]